MWRGENSTHSENGRVVWHLRRSWLRLFWLLLDSQVLHIATTEDNVVVDGVVCGNLFGRVAFTTFGAEGGHILEGYGGVLRVDLDEGTDVALMLC